MSDETHNTEETALTQELRQKLTMSAAELEAVRAELTTQLQQAMEMADAAEEESHEEQKIRVQNLESEVAAKSQALYELENELE